MYNTQIDNFLNGKATESEKENIELKEEIETEILNEQKEEDYIKNHEEIIRATHYRTDQHDNVWSGAEH